jgi:hypothetical protein
VSQITDAATINKLSEQMSLSSGEPKVEVTTEAPADSRVHLPGGYIKPDGTVVKYVEVRELNGIDEEAIAKSGTPAKALLTILARGLVDVDGDRPSKDVLDALLSGDRDAIMLGIRKVTFGKEAKLESFCPTCEKVHIFDIDLDKDVKVTELDNPIDDRSWTAKIKKGEVTLVLPNGITQRKVMEASDKTTAEINTMILSGCVLAVNGSPARPNTVLELGIQDRETLILEIMDRNPGPRLMGVTKACEACGTEVAVPLSLAALFRL